MPELVKITLSEDDIEEMVNALKRVPHYREYLQITLDNDMKRFFQCQPSEQQLVRGAYMRTQYDLSMISGDEEKKKLNGKKYSKI